MDRLDQDIMGAKKSYAPSKNFTANTMKKINASQKKQRTVSWVKPFILSGAAFASAVFIFSFISGINPNSVNSPSQPVQNPTGITASAAQTTASQIADDITSLDKEVASYAVSYSDTALNDINQ